MGQPYLAIQTTDTTIVLSDYDTTVTAYSLKDPSFPAPTRQQNAARARAFGADVSGPQHELATRSIPLDCLGVTEAAAEDALIALQRAVDTHRAQLVWRSSAGSKLISTTIRDAYIAEDTVTKTLRVQGRIRISLTLVTDPEWTGAAVPFAFTAFAAPGTVDLDITDGDRPARVALKVTSSATNTALGLGVKHAPAADFDPIDEYGSPSAVTLTSTFAALGTAPVLDTNANRGSYIMLADVATNAVTATNTRYRAASAVTGSGVATSATAVHRSTAARSTTRRWTALPGPVYVPGGAVPSLATGSGYGAAATLMENDAAGTKSLDTSQVIQTAVAETGFIVTRLGVKLEWPAAAGRMMTVFVSKADFTAKGRGQIITDAAQAAGMVYFDIEPWDGYEPVFSNGDEIIISVDTSEPSTKKFNYYYTTGNVYAGGEISTDADRDLVFDLVGRPALGFETTTTVQAACSESSKTATLYNAVRLPDDFACVIEKSLAAGGGVYIENTDALADPIVFETTSTEGTAGPALAPSVWMGSPRLQPGVNRIIVAAAGNVTVSGTYSPCYSNAAAGSV